MAVGYLAGKGSAKALKTKTNVPLLLTLGIILDIDILFRRFIEHRGPTHSVIVAFIAFLPFFAVYRRRAIPYYVALIQHSMIGDMLSGNGAQLFWPFTTQTYGFALEITNPINITIETLALVAALAIMVKAKDMNELFRPHKSNFILLIPVFTVLLPAIIGFPLSVPLSLLPQHLILMLMFSASILVELANIFTQVLRPEAFQHKV